MDSVKKVLPRDLPVRNVSKLSWVNPCAQALSYTDPRVWIRRDSSGHITAGDCEEDFVSRPVSMEPVEAQSG